MPSFPTRKNLSPEIESWGWENSVQANLVKITLIFFSLSTYFSYFSKIASFSSTNYKSSWVLPILWVFIFLGKTPHLYMTYTRLINFRFFSLANLFHYRDPGEEPKRVKIFSLSYLIKLVIVLWGKKRSSNPKGSEDYILCSWHQHFAIHKSTEKKKNVPMIISEL